MNEEYMNWARRNGFSEWALGLFWVLAGFLLFQLLGTVAAVGLLLWKTGGQLNAMNATDMMQNHLNLVFLSNTIGQVVVLALGTWFFVRLHTSKQDRRAYLRLRMDESVWPVAGLGIVLIVVLQPLIWFLGWLNAQLPMPDSLIQMEQVQNDIIESYLKQGQYIWLTLLHVSLVPAFCEELLFRGYLQRVLEKSWGIVAAIIVTGVTFGIFHLRLTQLLPLALIGMLLAYLTWKSNSLLPAMLGHLVNNGGSVMMAYLFPQMMFAEINPDAMPPLWMVLLSLALSGFVIYIMNRGFTSPNKMDQDYA